MASPLDPQGYPKLDIKAARALNPHVRTILIESILGGQSPLGYFASKNQFLDSAGIDPSLSTSTIALAGQGRLANIASGLLVPSGVSPAQEVVAMNAMPLWIKGNPKTNTIYVLNALSSLFTFGSGSINAISDGGSLTSGSGNGMEYYDNYMYIAKNTDIARFGPLDGAPIFDATYWTSTLSKAALTNTSYPSNGAVNNLSNHYLHRHSDGKLYIGDVQGNQGTIHVISTTKTTVEGDTDNGSTASKLQFGYGLWPTVIESYGSNLFIALYEGSTGAIGRQQRAKFALWDTISQTFQQISWDEFPDPLITAMKNINGVIYIASGTPGTSGMRITRYVGGNTVEEVAYYEGAAIPPLPGGFDGNAKRLLFGTGSYVDGNVGAIGSFGLQKASLGQGQFTPMRSTSGAFVSALLLAQQGISSLNLGKDMPVFGHSGPGINFPSDTYTSAPAVWQSAIYRLPRPAKITKIYIPLVNAVNASTIITPTIFTDGFAAGNGTALTVINNTNFPGQLGVFLRPNGLTVQNRFFLQLRWTSSDLTPVSLPISIDYESLLD